MGRLLTPDDLPSELVALIEYFRMLERRNPNEWRVTSEFLDATGSANQVTLLAKTCNCKPAVVCMALAHWFEKKEGR